MSDAFQSGELNRRAFLKNLAGLSVGGSLLTACAGNQAASAATALLRAPLSQRIGVQLYSVRDLMQQDFEETIARVAEIGYNDVEFAGYFGLEPLLVADVATPPVAADLLLGRDRITHSQVIKQPDVLMLHHLVPGEVEPGSLAPNLDFYLPRTAHGSSLSPAVSATLLARAGRPDDALAMLGVALRLDLDDTTGMTAGGLHLANLAGVWQAVLTGFAGVSVTDGALTVDPRLPSTWPALRLRFRCLGRRIALSIVGEQVRLHTDGPIRATLPGGRARQIEREAVT